MGKLPEVLVVIGRVPGRFVSGCVLDAGSVPVARVSMGRLPDVLVVIGSVPTRFGRVWVLDAGREPVTLVFIGRLPDVFVRGIVPTREATAGILATLNVPDVTLEAGSEPTWDCKSVPTTRVRFALFDDSSRDNLCQARPSIA